MFQFVRFTLPIHHFTLHSLFRLISYSPFIPYAHSFFTPFSHSPFIPYSHSPLIPIRSSPSHSSLLLTHHSLLMLTQLPVESTCFQFTPLFWPILCSSQKLTSTLGCSYFGCFLYYTCCPSSVVLAIQQVLLHCTHLPHCSACTTLLTA